MTTHIHAGGMVGGFSVCGESKGTVVNDADKSDCVICITKVRDYIKKYPKSPYVDEVKRACSNVGISYDE